MDKLQTWYAWPKHKAYDGRFYCSNCLNLRIGRLSLDAVISFEADLSAKEEKTLIASRNHQRWLGLTFCLLFSSMSNTVKAQQDKFAPVLSITPGAGFDLRYLDERFYLGTPLTLDFQSRAVSLRLQAPLFWNLEPVTLAPEDPAGCSYLRCEDWLVKGELSMIRLSRIVRHFRLGDGDSDYFIRGGALNLRLGQGLLINGYHNQIHWDLRTSGVYGKALIWGTPLTVTAFAGSFLGAPTLFGGRLGAAHQLGAADQLRFEWGVDAFTDPFMSGDAAALGAMGDIDVRLVDRSLSGVAADGALPFELFDQLLIFRPYVGVSTLRGFSRYGQDLPEWGVGALAGLQFWLTLPWVGLYAEALYGYSTAAHYFGAVDVTYELEKRLSLVETTTEGDTFLYVPRVSGTHQAYEMGFQWSDALTGNVRLNIPPAQRGALLHANLQWASQDVLLGVHWISKKSWTEIQADYTPTVALGEAAFRIWGDWSVWSRYSLGPRLVQEKSVQWQRSQDALFGFMWQRRFAAK